MKIKVVNEPWNDRLSVLLYSDADRKRYVVKPVDLVAVELKEGEDVKPTFEISRHEAQEFLKSMAEMAESMGIKTDLQLNEEVKNKGVLESTKYHLEDMRKLVFKNKTG